MQVTHKCKPRMIIHKGASYEFPINLKIGGKVIHKDDVNQVDFLFEDLKKTYPNGGVTHDGESFVLPLSVKETASMNPTPSAPLEVKVTFKSDVVKIDKKTTYTVIDTRSAEEVKNDE